MKTVFITGTSNGIGKEIAKFFKKKKWYVIGLDKVKHAEFTDIFIHYDLAKPINKNFILGKLSNINQINLLINNAAIQIAKPIFEYNLEDLNISFKVNCIAIFELVQILRKKLDRGSSIINICSVHSIATSPNLSSYVASKGAVLSLTRAFALELAPLGIKVNSISPGAVNTDMLKEGLKRAGKKYDITKKIPLQKIIEPIEIAKLCYFLTKEDITVTGQNFIIDGGVTAQLSSEIFEV